MFTRFILIFILICYQNFQLISYAQPTLSWASNIGGNSLGLTIDKTGNILTTGYFSGTLDFDPGPAVHNLTSFGPAGDVFVYKADAAGNFVWAKNMGGNSGARGNSIIADKLGNVYTAGIYVEEADFDPGPGIENLPGVVGHINSFISKLDASGNFVWAKGVADIAINSVKTDHSGNVITTGYFGGTADFDPGPGTFTMTSTALNGSDIFILKLDSVGNFVWAKSMNATANTQSRSVAVDKAGNIYTTGDFSGTVDFDPGPGVFNLTRKGFSDLFLSKLDSAGQFVWAKSIGASGCSTTGISIAADTSNQIAITGEFNATIDFDPGVAVNNLVSTTPNASDIFVMKLDTASNFVWAKSMGGKNSEKGIFIALDDSANAYVTGWFMDSADFDPNTPVYQLKSSGPSDIFTVKLDRLGNLVWANNIGGNGWDYPNGIAVDNFKNVYSTGQFTDSGDVDPGPDTYILSSESGTRSYLLKLSPQLTPSVQYYRTRQSGNWNDAATWESSTTSDFTSGITSPAATSPDAANCFFSVIRNGHAVTVTTNVTTHSPTINRGGNLNVNAGVLFTVLP